MDCISQKNQSADDRSTPCLIPRGYCLITGPDNHDYLLPDFMVPDIQFAWERDKARTLLGVDSAARGVSSSIVVII